jgi:hypothetical protein
VEAILRKICWAGEVVIKRGGAVPEDIVDSVDVGLFWSKTKVGPVARTNMLNGGCLS